jgi:GT2 family glycosyltransferase
VSISVLIANHNGGPLLRDCLASAFRALPTAEVIVVDNASTDGSQDLVRTEFPTAQLVALEENVGFAQGNNLAYARAKGETLILLNSDAELPASGFDACLDMLEREPTLAAIAPRLVGNDGQVQPSCLPGPSLRRAFLRSFWREPKQITIDPRKAVVWLPATCLILRRAALDSVGGLFDEQFYLYWEDADLCARLIRQGWRLAVCEDATVLHHGRAAGIGPKSVDRTDRLSWYSWGRHRWFRKHRNWTEYVLVLWLDVFYAARLFLRSFLSEKFHHERERARVVMRSIRISSKGQSPHRLDD